MINRVKNRRRLTFDTTRAPTLMPGISMKIPAQSRASLGFFRIRNEILYSKRQFARWISKKGSLRPKSL